MEILWKLHENCLFPQNFHLKKYGEIKALYAVMRLVRWNSRFPSALVNYCMNNNKLRTRENFAFAHFSRSGYYFVLTNFILPFSLRLYISARSYNWTSFMRKNISAVPQSLHEVHLVTGNLIFLESATQKVSVFGVILFCIFHHLDWIRKNTDHNNSEYGHFLRSEGVLRNFLGYL